LPLDCTEKSWSLWLAVLRNFQTDVARVLRSDFSDPSDATSLRTVTAEALFQKKFDKFAGLDA